MDRTTNSLESFNRKIKNAVPQAGRGIDIIVCLRELMLTESSIARSKITQSMDPSLPKRKNVDRFLKIKEIISDMNFRQAKDFSDSQLETLMNRLIEKY